MTQNSMVLEHLKKGRSLSPAEAMHGMGIYRLAARIKDLKNAGHNITTEMHVAPNGSRYAEYRLVPETGLQHALPFAQDSENEVD